MLVTYQGDTQKRNLKTAACGTQVQARALPPLLLESLLRPQNPPASFPGGKGNSVKQRQFSQVIIPGTHTSHGSDKSTTKSFFKKGEGGGGPAYSKQRLDRR